MRNNVVVILSGLFFLVLPLFSSAQENPEINDIVEDAIEFIQQESQIEDIDYSGLYDQLYRLYKKQPNLNTLSRENFESLQFLSPLTIQNILAYRNEYGGFLEHQELEQVPGISAQEINWLLAFTTIGNTQESFNQINEARKEAKTEIATKISKDLTPKQGYLGEIPVYSGDAIKLYTRIKHTIPNKLTVALITEKDPGETYFQKNNVGILDYTSGHAQYFGDGLISTAIVGDFQYTQAQGLLFNNRLGFNKSAQTLKVRKTNNGFKGYTSVNENEFLRGAGLQLSKKGWSINALISNKKVDGNVDSLTQEVYSIYTSGLHRTESEIKRKDAISEQIGLVHIKKQWGRLEAGVSALHYQIQQKANNQLLLGADATYQLKKGYVFSEIVTDDKNHISGILGSVISLNSKVAVTLAYRNYHPDFENRYANPFSASGRGSNETGLYVGWEVRLSQKWLFNAYFDQFTNPTGNSKTNFKARQNDWLAQLQYTERKKFSIYGRVRRRLTQNDIIDESLPIATQVEAVKWNIRLHTEFKLEKGFSLRTRIEQVLNETQSNKKQGYLLYQDLIWKPKERSTSVTLRYALFDTETFNERIYAFENDLLYSYSIPAYYYSGQRFYILLKTKPIRHFDFWARYAVWNYSNRTTIGSGNETISGSSKPNLSLLLRYRF